VKLYFLPHTRLGKWSLWLVIAFFVLLGAFEIFVFFGERGGDTFFSNIRLSLLILPAGLAAIGGFFTGIIGIIKSREHAVLVFLTTLIGFFVLFFVAGELLVPH
jgi:hypothetical protein